MREEEWRRHGEGRDERLEEDRGTAEEKGRETKQGRKL